VYFICNKTQLVEGKFDRFIDKYSDVNTNKEIFREYLFHVIF